MDDDYDLQQVLESMAQAAGLSSLDVDTTGDISETVSRWQRLFDLSHDEATDRIVQHRNKLSRIVVSDDHWTTVQAHKERAGYDREAYEYELNLEKSKAELQNSLLSGDDVDSTAASFLLQLNGPLADVETVRLAAGLDKPPEVVQGRSSETWSSVDLCCIDVKAKADVLKWSADHGYEPVVLVDPRSFSVA